MRPDQQVSKRAILYARTSADSENEGLKLSILLRLDTSMSGRDYGGQVEEQLDACKNLAQSQGYNIIGKYFDRNRSGRTYPTGSPCCGGWERRGLVKKTPFAACRRMSPVKRVRDTLHPGRSQNDESISVVCAGLFRICASVGCQNVAR